MTTGFFSGITAAIILSVGLFGLERLRNPGTSQSRKRWGLLLLILVLIALFALFGLTVVVEHSSSFARLSHRF